MNNISSRKDNAELPSLSETYSIRSVEAERPPYSSLTDVHFVDFHSMIALLVSYGLSADFFEGASRDGRVDGRGVDAFRPIYLELIARILSDHDSHRSVLDAVYDYLSEEDELSYADIAIVFGGKSDARPERAAQLYNDGHCGSILCCGRGPIYNVPPEGSEAEHYARILRQSGIPETKIFVESKSVTIPDNVRSSLNLLDEKGVVSKAFALVTSPFCQRRTYACIKKYLPEDVVVMRVNAQPSHELSRDHWFETERGIRVVINEFVKMSYAMTHGDA